MFIWANPEISEQFCLVPQVFTKLRFHTKQKEISQTSCHCAYQKLVLYDTVDIMYSYQFICIKSAMIEYNIHVGIFLEDVSMYVYKT